jgi:hypothetical protein
MILFEGVKYLDTLKFCPLANQAGKMLQRDAVRKIVRKIQLDAVCCESVNTVSRFFLKIVAM